MAVGLAAASLGSETDGSIVSPSSKNNIVGIKPTIGLVPRTKGNLEYDQRDQTARSLRIA